MFWLLVALAHAAPWLELPPDEAPGDWESAFALVEPAGATGVVRVRIDGDTWVLTAAGASGARTARVPKPRSGRAREDVAMLAASLLEPGPIATLPLPRVAAPVAPGVTPQVVAPAVVAANVVATKTLAVAMLPVPPPPPPTPVRVAAETAARPPAARPRPTVPPPPRSDASGTTGSTAPAAPADPDASAPDDTVETRSPASQAGAAVDAAAAPASDAGLALDAGPPVDAAPPLPTLTARAPVDAAPATPIDAAARAPEDTRARPPLAAAAPATDASTRAPEDTRARPPLAAKAPVPATAAPPAAAQTEGAPPPTLSVTAGPSATFRAGLTPGPGARLGGHVDIGLLTAGAQVAASFARTEPDHPLTAARAAALVGARLPGGAGLYAEVGPAVELFVFREDGADPQTGLTSALVAEVGAGVGVTGWLRVEVFAEGGLDLRGVALVQRGETVAELGRAWIGAGLLFRARSDPEPELRTRWSDGTSAAQPPAR
ncbi:MAG: hypothetical protein V4850_25730 [Myxococcota bacterium]